MLHQSRGLCVLICKDVCMYVGMNVCMWECVGVYLGVCIYVEVYRHVCGCAYMWGACNMEVCCVNVCACGGCVHMCEGVSEAMCECGCV